MAQYRRAVKRKGRYARWKLKIVVVKGVILSEAFRL